MLRFLLISLTLFYVLPHFLLKKMTGQFTLTGIASRLEYHPEWETPIEDEEKLTSILSQKFTYLDVGKQCFVFVSEDGRYVIKFFQLFKRRLPDAFAYIPLPNWLDAKRQKATTLREIKLHRDFNSYRLAYEELREESGLVYVHLNKTNHLQKNLTIIDKIGIAHAVSLDDTEFLIQRRASLTYETLNEFMKQGQEELAKERIKNLVDLTLSRYQKGIYDDDAFISKNYGFEGSEARFIDIGHFVKKEQICHPEVYREDLSLILGRFKRWLEKTHPSLHLYLIEYEKKIISS